MPFKQILMLLICKAFGRYVSQEHSKHRVTSGLWKYRQHTYVLFGKYYSFAYGSLGGSDA